jgi:hypothetical protein
VIVPTVTMKFLHILFTLTILGVFKVSNSYQILAIYALPIRSHFIMINEVLKGLVEKGHKVDIINPLPHKEANPNYTQIIRLPENQNLLSNGLSYQEAHNLSNSMFKIGLLGYEICQYLGHPEFLHLARNPPKDPPYDLIITQVKLLFFFFFFFFFCYSKVHAYIHTHKHIIK